MVQLWDTKINYKVHLCTPNCLRNYMYTLHVLLQKPHYITLKTSLVYCNFHPSINNEDANTYPQWHRNCFSMDMRTGYQFGIWRHPSSHVQQCGLHTISVKLGTVSMAVVILTLWTSLTHSLMITNNLVLQFEKLYISANWVILKLYRSRSNLSWEDIKGKH